MEESEPEISRAEANRLKVSGAEVCWTGSEHCRRGRTGSDQSKSLPGPEVSGVEEVGPEVSEAKVCLDRK